MIRRLAPRTVVASGLAPGTVAPAPAQLSRRFTAAGRSAGFWVALWAAVVAAEIAVLVPIVLADEPTPGYRIVFRLIGGTFAACGLIAWHRRPDSRSGMWMVATGFGLLIEPLFDQFDPSAIRTIGDLLEDAWGIPIIALLLTFLSGGRLDSRVDRALVGIWVVQLTVEFVRHVFLAREGNFLLVSANAEIADALITFNELIVSIGCLAVAGVIGARWKRASRPRRRAMLPSVAGIAALLFFAVAQQATPTVVQWLAVCSLLAIPAAFLAGLLRSRLARGGLTELFRDLRTMHGAALQARLAKALGDPTLVLAYGRPGSRGHADADGRPVLVPPVTADRAVAPIEREGREVAALVYDVIARRRSGAASRRSAPRPRSRSRTSISTPSRALGSPSCRRRAQRIVAAGDAERRRLERDLHDGAQQRLVALALQLRLIQADIRRDPAMAEQLVTSASGELAAVAAGAARARARHPPGGARSRPGCRARVAGVAVDGADGGVVRRARAPASSRSSSPPTSSPARRWRTSASTRTPRRRPCTCRASGGGVAIEIADDGVGGADAAGGSGLRGLADRVEALDGHLCRPAQPERER